ncbi:MAG: AbrB/MazE/SpoVT family DNA-binding domain-containing protein, partial [Desulfurococcales archaeon]|nr:AbrB/MazE/SpoVT family DNA-binding domain-containing protein [Desulfurococcales archaeon]
MTQETVEERRVQRLGTSSLIVTLPKRWVKRIGLKPGDAVTVISRDNYLIIKPKNFEDKINSIELSADNIDNIPEDTLLKIIKCLYFINYEKIIVDLSRLKATTVNRLIITLRDLPGTEHEIIDNKVIIYIKKENQEKIIKSLSRLIENLTLILRSVEEYLDKGVKKELVIDTRNLLDESLKAYNN